MGMEALFAGVSGLQVNQQMLDVIGNNLANSNTTAYKAQSVSFSDLIYQNLSDGSPADGTINGGTNPIQMGSGAQVAAITSDQQQGTLQSTDNELDLALQGNGYFVARSGSNIQFTRSGSFGVDASNYLVDPATGDRVQRFGSVGEGSAASPAFQAVGNGDIKIPIGSAVPGHATSSVTLQGNLDAAANDPVAQTLTSAAPFTTGQPPMAATSATALDSLSDSIAPYAAGDTITLQGTDAAGNAVNTTVPVGPVNGQPFTLGDLVTAINTNVPGATASIDGSGNLVLQSNTSGVSQLNLTIADGANTNGGNDVGGSNWTNHGLAITAPGAAGDTVQASIDIYDPQGTAHTLNLTFQKAANNTWNLTGSINPSEGIMTDNLVANLQFGQDGSFSQAAGTGLGDSTMTVQFNGFSAPQKIAFNFGAANGFDGLTQNGSASSAAATSQDGYSSGFLSTLAIAQDGTINGVFTNGQTIAIAQIAVANFANPGGLQRVGNNYYTVSGDSGAPLIGAGLAGGNGAVEQKQLESSNVDVSLEFTRLIVAQQGYQVNAHVITAADQILQDLGNILR